MKHLLMIVLVILALPASIASCSPQNLEPEPETQQPSTPVTPQPPGNNGNPGNSGEDGNNGSGDNNQGGSNNEDGNNNQGGNNNDGNMSNRFRIRIGSSSFTATLEDNAAAKAFRALLPMTITMSEMNGNEKYYYLPENLPTASANPGTLRSGDLMLFGSSCLVLFYEAFSTSYSYTRLGRIDNASELSSALGSGNVRVTFETE